jgi:hypothetical protein
LDASGGKSFTSNLMLLAHWKEFRLPPMTRMDVGGASARPKSPIAYLLLRRAARLTAEAILFGPSDARIAASIHSFVCLIS